MEANNNTDFHESQIQSRSTQHSSSSSPPPPPSHDGQFFEFLSGGGLGSSDMCPAEDIIFCGKLIASSGPQPSASSTFQQTKSSSIIEDDDKRGAVHRRSESFSDLQSYVTHSNNNITHHHHQQDHQYLRMCRSLDYQTPRRFSRSSKTTSSSSPDEFDMHRRSAFVRSPGKADNNNNNNNINNRKASSSKPKWYLPLFGIVKFQPQMDMRDIKSRQSRRRPSETEVIFPPRPSTNNKSSSSSSSSSSSWRFIKALSCSDHASVAVTASFCVSHA